MKTLAAILVIAGATASATSYARPEKVNVCHRTGNGSFHLINIAEPALDAHLRHGDVIAPEGEGTVEVGLETGETALLDSSCAFVTPDPIPDPEPIPDPDPLPDPEPIPDPDPLPDPEPIPDPETPTE